MKFGELLKDYRIRKGLTLRECCAELEVDPSNWSKMERGVNPGPKDTELLSFWSEYFGLNDSEKQSFTDSAALSRSELPIDIATDEAIMSKLPAFFRAARNSELTSDKFADLIKDIRKLHTRDADV